LKLYFHIADVAEWNWALDIRLSNWCYMIFSINLVLQVALRSSGTGILYGCYLLRCLYNIFHFLWLYDDFFIIVYDMLKIAELDCSQIIILSIYLPCPEPYSTRPHPLCENIASIVEVLLCLVIYIYTPAKVKRHPLFLSIYSFTSILLKQ
jgi:hypothetical protein